MSYTLSRIAKALVAFIVGASAFVGTLVEDGEFGTTDVITLVGWLATTGLVYFVPNKGAAAVDGGV